MSIMETIEYNPDNLPSAEADRWTPILDGDVFCSPACGYRCKLADYERAVESAKSLSNLLGGGWHPHIWENGGWLYEVTKGQASVCPDGDSYVAEINVDYISESNILSIRKTNSDPRRAVEELVLSLDETIGRLSRAKASVALDSISIEDVDCS